MNNLEKMLNIEFKDKELLKTALTHSSYANEHNLTHNERLEFLGDAVLELCMSEYLYCNFDLSEGEMTKRRAQSVCEDALIKYAKKIEFSKYLLLGHGEEQNGGRERPAIVADAFEAVLGAVFLEKGFLGARDVFYNVVVPNISLVNNIKDYKSTLQEYVQSFKMSLQYVLEKEEGPSHKKVFTVLVMMEDVILGRGIGKTKKEAEQFAAKEALEKMSKIKE